MRRPRSRPGATCKSEFGIRNSERTRSSDFGIAELPWNQQKPHAGQFASKVAPDRTRAHLTAPEHTPVCNLYLEMLLRIGIEEKSFGDSTGPLEGLA